MQGNDADNTLTGYASADVLTGGKGNDQLLGAGGNDTYRYALGDGNDVINDASGIDALVLTDLSPDQVVLRRAGNDLLIRMDASGQTIKVLNQFAADSKAATGNAIDEIRFANAVVFNAAAIAQQAVAGTVGDDVIWAHPDADIIAAGSGNDEIFGLGGNDQVDGGDGNDHLLGGDGADALSGGSGTDLLEGEGGNDSLHGGEGNDTLNGGAGNDALYGEAGNDSLVGNGLLDGGAGDDSLDGTGQLIGGDGNDRLKGQGFDTLRGGAGNDTLEAHSDAWDQGSNTLEGGAGNDSLYGSFGEDTYVFNLGDGRDLLIERRANEAFSNIAPSADTLSFGAGIRASDLSFSRSGLNMVIGHVNRTDVITIQNWFKEPSDHFKLDSFRFADGSVLSLADVESKVVYKGSAGDDSLLGYRELNDQIRAGAGNDQVWGRAGDDLIYGDAGNDYLDGDAGTDRLLGGVGDDNLQGRDGNDRLEGGSDNDNLSGGNGSDILKGDDGHDQLAGGAGKDKLFGGLGNDKYIYNPGGSVDTIDNSGGGYDGVFFTDGISAERLSFSRDANDLLIKVDGDVRQAVRVLGHFLGADKAIGYVQPDGGYLINAERIGHMVAANGVPGDFKAVIDGSAAAEQLSGYDGRDLLRGLAGNDKLFGMSGDDQLEGGDGDDYLSGGNGQAQGSGKDVLNGGLGNDVLDGEDGDDAMTGGAGDDKYYYRATGGVDVIDNSGGGFDGVFFLSGIDRPRLSFHREGDDLLILVDKDLTQQVRVAQHFLGADYAIDYVQPDGGGYLTGAQIAGLLSALPDGSGGDTGEPGDGDTNPGGGDTQPGDGGQPPVPGVGGADVLTGSAGQDVLIGGAGNDSLSGAAGNDRLLGGVGDDTYIYTAGLDGIEEQGGGNDTLRFSNGITFNQVSSGLTKSGNDLILKVNGSTTNQVSLKDFFLGGDNLVETFTFETGGQLTAVQIFDAFGIAMPTPTAAFDNSVQGSTGNDGALNGTAQRDLLQGFNGNDQLLGAAGNDRLEGGNGNDSLNGGVGNDSLLGGRGDDSYVFAAGGGQDVIENKGGGVDALRFEGIDFNQVSSGLMRSGNDLVLNVSGGTDKVTLKNWFLGGDSVVDSITFASGGALTAAQIFSAFGLTNPDANGSPNYQNLPDERAFGTLVGGQAGDQYWFGSSDADLIDGGSGNDQLRGNQGNDYLMGGDGNDTYRFAAGDGQDSLNNLSNTPADNDVLSIEGITRENLWLSREGNSLLIDVTGSLDRITVQDWYVSAEQQLDAIQVGSTALYANKVDTLVNAMAAFGAPAGGEINLAQAQRDQLNAVIVAIWRALCL
ncbi:MAG: calcium-binding protein [Pseudomonas sp.]|uniref:calcium-binding protein n=1 Tax=Pseudomonas sp. TaxID=306 RepID=UPI002736AF81|nr:calcium-binding protein [Pseudomonas sp.]MDP3847970.1 calcium-binding protein [Pseudomonas sp.]